MSQRGHAAKVALRERRSLLGIGARRSADPRQIARVVALDRSTQLAEALLAPLDDEGLGSMAKQRAAVIALDATFPLSTISVEVSLPQDEAGVAAMGWAEMQQLAGVLLDDQVSPDGSDPT